MGIIDSLASWYFKKRMHQIELFLLYPNEVQLELFEGIIGHAKNTAVGKKFDFSSIDSVKDFQERVPVRTYEEMHDDIARVMHGESDVLWPGKIKWFAKSSGTTNDKSKFIPISTQSLEDCHYKGGQDLLCIYFHNNPNSKLFSGKNLVLGGSHQINQYNPDSYYGDLSAVLIQNRPFWVQFVSSPTIEVALMSEWETKVERMARETMNENITSICGVPTWVLVLIQKIFQLKKITSGNLLEVWPQLELFIHGAVSFIPYRQQFHQMIPASAMNYVETYNASEGFFGIQNEPDKHDMLLMLDYGIFYEFIDMNEFYSDHPRARTLDEVELNKNYALVISTNGGLWRYVIGDTVKFTSLNPFKIVITGRTKHFINAFGEELIIDNAERAITVACKETEAEIEDYTAAPIYFEENKNGGHEWMIEFKKPPKNFEQFKIILDNTLKSLNSDYEAKRYKNLALHFPVIHAVPERTFYNWMKSRKKLGGQNKVPRLCNDRTYMDEILAMIDGKTVAIG